MAAPASKNPQLRALKRALLAVTVYHDIDFEPGDDGIVMCSGRVHVSWEQCLAGLGGLPANHPVAADVLARFLRTLITLDGMPELLIADRVRIVGLPVDHVRNPGLAWVIERVHGDALDLGLGMLGLDASHPERVDIVPPAAWEVLDLDPLRWWRAARNKLEQFGEVAAARLTREPDALRPVADSDALTLLGSRAFRAALAAREGGMAALAVPMRRRGWTRLSLLDPAFARAAALATDPVDRGFAGPILVTVDEVASAGDGSWTLEALLDGRLHAADVAPVQRA